MSSRNELSKTKRQEISTVMTRPQILKMQDSNKKIEYMYICKDLEWPYLLVAHPIKTNEANTNVSIETY